MDVAGSFLSRVRQYVIRMICRFVFFFQAEDGIRDGHVTGVQTCALPISYFKNASANTALCIWRLDVVPVLPQKASYTACVPATLSKYLHVDIYACIF